MIRFRSDIEGLRAVAVLLVVLNHLGVPGFGGGYIGVDVFFVISGYLITSLLTAEYANTAQTNAEGTGSISLRHFYVRRARRILPAGLTVIAATYLAGHLLLNSLRVGQIDHDALWAVGFSSNFNFIHQATNYFQQNGPASPLQHYWSLAVEEQYYLAWPTIFILIAGLHGLRVGGRKIRWRGRVGAALGLLGVASLAWSIYSTPTHRAAAYFSTFTRAWELALGAALAVATSRQQQGPTRAAEALTRIRANTASAVGVGLLLAGCAVIGGSTLFPGFAALLPTLGAAALIIGGIEGSYQPWPNKLLATRPFRFVGRISYSLYLWHWPIIVFAAALYPSASTAPLFRGCEFAAFLLIATVSYYLIERPARRVTIRLPNPRYRAHLARRASIAWQIPVLVGTTVLALAVVFGFAAHAQQRSPESVVLVAQPLRDPAIGKVPLQPRRGSPARVTSSAAATLVSWQKKVLLAEAVKKLPRSLQPLQSHLANYANSCADYLDKILQHEQDCQWGNIRASRVAVLTGDSHSLMFLPVLEAALGSRDWLIHPYVRPYCGWAGDSPNTSVVSDSECHRLQRLTLDRVRSLHPTLLVLSEDKVVSATRTSTDIANALATYAGLATHVVVIGHTPKLPSFATCLSGTADVSNCFGSPDYGSVRTEQSAAATAGVTFIDTTPWFCYVELCPPVIDGVPVMTDGDHMTREFSAKLTVLLRISLKQASTG